MIDAASIKNQGAFATLNKITSGNATTFIDNAAIGNAQIDRATVNKLVVTNADIDRASVNKLQVVTADIVDANVSTLKIAGNAVTVPLAVYTDSAINPTSYSWLTIQSLSTGILSSEITSVSVAFGASLGATGAESAPSDCSLRLLVNDSVVFQSLALRAPAGFFLKTLATGSIKFNLPANTNYSIQLQMAGDYGYINAANRFINLLVVKR